MPRPPSNERGFDCRRLQLGAWGRLVSFSDEAPLPVGGSSSSASGPCASRCLRKTPNATRNTAPGGTPPPAPKLRRVRLAISFRHFDRLAVDYDSGRLDLSSLGGVQVSPPQIVQVLPQSGVAIFRALRDYGRRSARNASVGRARSVIRRSAHRHRVARCRRITAVGIAGWTHAAKSLQRPHSSSSTPHP